MLLKHICETCGKTEIMESQEAFEKGWDYPPAMYKFGVISPRTCPNCTINTTLWWEISFNHTPIDKLNERHTATLARILNEPKSILVDSNDRRS